MVSWQAFPSLPPRAPLAPKTPFPSLSNACHAGYSQLSAVIIQRLVDREKGLCKLEVFKAETNCAARAF